MASEPEERSESGAPVYRHERRERDFELASGDDASIEVIARHVERHVGKPAWVFHEIISDLVHLDVHIVGPTQQRNYYTLVTTGMSDRPMTPPADLPECRYAELLICLPPDWPLSEEAFKDEANYWPVRWLKLLSRLPHEYQTWLWEGHTVPNGDPPRPFAKTTKLCCALLLEPTLFGEEFPRLEVGPEKAVHFFSLVPIHGAEMDFKLRNGVDALVERLDDAGVTELLDVRRASVC
jgi:hypothetical protein